MLPGRFRGQTRIRLQESVENWDNSVIVRFRSREVWKSALPGSVWGSRDCMTKEVQQTIETADILLGAERMIADYSARIEKKPYYMAAQILPYLEKLQESEELAQQETLRVAVLFSGDTGFYSGCRKLYVELQEAIAAGQLRGSVRILPGISSVVSLAARVGESYEDAAILSMHGKKLNHLPTTVVSHEKTFLLTSGSEDIRKIGRMLTETGLTDCEVIVGYQLSYPEENIRILMPEQCVEVPRMRVLYTCCPAILTTAGTPDPRQSGHLFPTGCFRDGGKTSQNSYDQGRSPGSQYLQAAPDSWSRSL